MTANEKQVGGAHYKSTFQHWDLVVEAGLGYFEGQITKYITRHRYKNGLQDLDKAKHFATKLLELVVVCGRKPSHKYMASLRMQDYQDANKLTGPEQLAVWSACKWIDARDLETLISRIDVLRKQATDGSEPCSGYTNQD